LVGEAELSSGASISSVHPVEQPELQAGHTTTAYQAPTPEFLKLQLSPLHPPGDELDLSFDHDFDFTQDWNSNMVSGAQHKTSLDSFCQTLEHSPFAPPALPLVGGSHVSIEMPSTKAPVESPQDASQAGRECMCTAESLAMIPELQKYSTGRIELSVDGVLRLTRRGTSAISHHLGCPHHARTNSSQTSLLACILILMQVAACYTILRSSLEDPEYQKHFPVLVGGLNIEEDETRRHVVKAVLDAEVRKAAALNSRLEGWGLQLQTGSNALPYEQLLSFVRQELDRALEQR
jgi:hypothetical protein